MAIMADKATLMTHPVWAAYPLLYRVADLFLDFDETCALLNNLTSTPSEKKNMLLQDSNNLDAAFTWLRTKHGHSYWEIIHNHLMLARPAYHHARMNPDYHYDDLYPDMAVTLDFSHSVILDGGKKPKKEWQPDKADGDHVMSVTRDMF